MANTTTAGEDSWYNYFKEEQPESQWLLTAFGVRAIWAIMGLLSNLAMVYVTVVSKSLHDICNVLIALESFFAIFWEASYLVSFFIFVSGVKFIVYRLCFPMLILPFLCGNNAQLIMVLTGVDRLLCILFPIWYHVRNRRYYLLCVGIIVALYTGFGFTIQYTAFLENQQIMISCSMHDMKPGKLASLDSIQSATMSAIIMTIYVLIWFLGFILHPIAKNVSVKNKKIIKALVCIIGLNMLGVFFKEVMLFIFANFWKVSVFFKNSFAIGMSFLTITVYSVNGPVLYLFSTLYREQFNANFKFLRYIFCKRKVASLASINGQQHQQPHNNTRNMIQNVSSTINQQSRLQRPCLPAH